MDLPAGLTLKKIYSAIDANCGIVGLARRKLKLTPAQWYEVVKRWPVVSEYASDVAEQMVDVAESHIYDKIQEGEDTKLLQWFLDRRGKDRGYTTRNEMTGKDEAPISYAFDLNIIRPKKTEDTEDAKT